MVMVIGVDLAVSLEELPNDTTGRADAAPIGEGTARIRSRGIRMAPH